MAIEGALVQAEFTSDGDTLNYREQLFEKLSGLPAVVNSADALADRPVILGVPQARRPGRRQLAALTELIDGDLALLNRQLTELGVGIIGV